MFGLSSGEFFLLAGQPFGVPSSILLRFSTGLLLGVWTVNQERAIRRLVELGVDVLTSDRPDVAKRVLARAP